MSHNIITDMFNACLRRLIRRKYENPGILDCFLYQLPEMLEILVVYVMNRKTSSGLPSKHFPAKKWDSPQTRKNIVVGNFPKLFPDVMMGTFLLRKKNVSNNINIFGFPEQSLCTNGVFLNWRFLVCWTSGIARSYRNTVSDWLI